MFKLKLKGSALYLSLIIGVVISLLLSLFVVLSRYNHTQLLVKDIQLQLKYNLISGVNLATSPFFPETHNNSWTRLGINNDSLKIKTLRWGAYQFINVCSKNGRFQTSLSGFYGTALKKDTGLVIADNGRAISAAGEIRFNAFCYLPSSVLRPVFIEGMSYSGTSTTKSFIKPSPRRIPDLNNEYLSGFKNMISTYNSRTDSLVSELSPISYVSFDAKTAVLQTTILHLTDQRFKGNIKLIAKEVNISKTASLEDVLIVADKIRVQKGFNGNLHLMVKDSIIIEPDCQLNYPSSLVIYNPDPKEISIGLRGIYIGENSVIEGSIICYNDKVSDTEVPRQLVKLNKNCKVYGLVYCSGYGHLQGKIYGNVYCERLIVKSNSATYENHLIDTEIDPKKHSGSVLVAACFNEKSNWECCKKL